MIMSSRPLGPATGLLNVAAFASTLDRVALPIFLVVVASDLDSTVTEVAFALTLYMLGYAGAQLGWAGLARRLGPLRVVALALLLGACGAAATAASTSIPMLAITRAISGAAFAAAIPLALAYLGQSIAAPARPRAAAALVASATLGTVLGTIGAAAVVEAGWWRLFFATGAICAAVLGALLLRDRAAPKKAGLGFRQGVGRLLANPRCQLIYSLTALEGFAAVGIFTYLPAGITIEGTPMAIAGLSTATYGVAVLAVSRWGGRLIASKHTWLPLLTGGLALVAGYVVLAVVRTPVSGAIAAALIGAAWGLAHTAMQLWMIEVTSVDRTLGATLFSMALFAGGTAGVAVGGWLGEQGAFALVFAAGCGAAMLFTVSAPLIRLATPRL